VLLAIQLAIVAGFLAGVRAGAFPLGVRGEWEWPRLRVTPNAIDIVFAGFGLAVFALIAAVGCKRLSNHPRRGREVAWVAVLAVIAPAVQFALQSGAPEGYGLTKWVTLAMPGASGYFTVAKRQISDSRRFWAAYPAWIKHQDALHVGTHPPGLFLWARSCVDLMEAHPTIARAIVEHLPPSVDAGFREILPAVGPTSRPERAALALTGVLTLLACAWTAVPLYLLARSTLPPAAAWAAALLWPVIPAAILFQPTADTAFPFISTSALACAAWATGGRSRPLRMLLAVLAGALLGIGMQFSLVFLPVGLVVACLLVGMRGSRLGERAALVACTGVGFLGTTFAVWGISHANPFAIWWWNQKNHARFYQEYPRSYGAWVLANPLELAVAIGLPVAVWLIVAVLTAIGARTTRTTMAEPDAKANSAANRGTTVLNWATLGVLAILTLGGRSLSEVGRLWLPCMPALVVGAAWGLARFGEARTLAVTTALVGAQTLALQAMIQVVYPV
jgi:hypothetical protein